MTQISLAHSPLQSNVPFQLSLAWQAEQVRDPAIADVNRHVVRHRDAGEGHVNVGDLQERHWPARRRSMRFSPPGAKRIARAQFSSEGVWCKVSQSAWVELTIFDPWPCSSPSLVTVKLSPASSARRRLRPRGSAAAAAG